MDFDSAKRLATNLKAAYPYDSFAVFEVARGACLRGTALVDFGDCYVVRFNRSPNNNYYSCESVKTMSAPPIAQTATCEHGYERCRFISEKLLRYFPNANINVVAIAHGSRYYFTDAETKGWATFMEEHLFGNPILVILF